jgi:hypothetical protein
MDSYPLQNYDTFTATVFKQQFVYTDQILAIEVIFLWVPLTMT